MAKVSYIGEPPPKEWPKNVIVTIAVVLSMAAIFVSWRSVKLVEKYQIEAEQAVSALTNCLHRIDCLNDALGQCVKQ